MGHARDRRIRIDRSGSSRLLSRRTFSVEIWLHRDTTQVATTRVVQLETGEAQAWRGWHPARMIRFMYGRLGVYSSTGSVLGRRAD